MVHQNFIYGAQLTETMICGHTVNGTDLELIVLNIL